MPRLTTTAKVIIALPIVAGVGAVLLHMFPDKGSFFRQQMMPAATSASLSASNERPTRGVMLRSTVAAARR